MTNVTEQAAGALTLPAGDVKEILTRELCHSQEAAQTVVNWLAANGIAFVVNLLAALAIFVIGIYVIRLITYYTKHLVDRIGERDSILDRFVVSVVNKTAWALLAMIVLQRLGVNVMPLIAGMGVTGFILGFAFKESLGNLAAGMMIAINMPFRVGDYVTVGSVSGTVRDLNMMAATLFTSDNIKVVVPNNVIWGSPITNYTATDKRRMEITVGIAYDADITKAMRVALETLRADPRVLTDPAPSAELASLGDSAINLTLRPWTRPPDFRAARSALTQAVKEAFDKNAITIPFPQMDVHVTNT